MFINLTNHSSALWSDKQRTAAEIYGEIRDIPFPIVNPYSDDIEISKLADDYIEKIMLNAPSAVLCQGEMSLCYAIIERLKAAGVKALCATSERIVRMKVLPDGQTEKNSTFDFVRFRLY